jgi:pimeloyl-ACP methyl ester carboxylesterase
MHRFLAIGAVLLSGLASGLGSAQDQFFDSNGARIRYLDRGQGEPIIFLHGNTRSLEMWIDCGVLPNLERDYRVIAFDARGHGQSDKPHAREDYGREMGLDAIRLLDHLGIARAHFIGYSMGSHIVSQLMTSHPDRFLTATLGGAPGRFNWTEEEIARSELEAAEKEASCISRSQVLRAWPTDRPKPSEEELQRRSDACMADPQTDRFALAAFHRSRPDQTITQEQAAAVRVPTLGVVGSLDAYREDFEELKQLRPALQLVIIKGASHSGATAAYLRPEFLDSIRAFLASER